MRGLEGRTVVLLEARRAAEAADLVRRYGGEPWSTPAMREVPLDNSAESLERLQRLCQDGSDVVICLTGVGTRALFGLAADNGLEDRLREVFDTALVVVRGPKPTAVLREKGVRIDRTAAEPNTSRQVLEVIANDSFSRAAVQLYGGPDPDLVNGLKARSVEVLEIPVYKWALPENLAPLKELIAGGRRPMR